MSDGLIPLIRPAWPRERGRIALELLAGLGAKLGDRAVSRSAGMGLFSSRRNRSIWSIWRPI